MKILLIAPKMSLRPMDSEYKRRMTPSISLLVLAALTPKEHQIEILDENISSIKRPEKADLVGITCNVDTFERAAAIASLYREVGSPVILGGIFPSSCPEIAGRFADSVCIGEAEPVWNQILCDTASKTLQKVYRHTGEFASDMIPRPQWEIINGDDYLYTNIVTTSRGCPHACEFCYNSCDYTVKKYRRRPIGAVVKEIQRLGTRQVLFVDDNFIGDSAWLDDFLTAIAPMKLTWHAAVSANIGKNSDILDRMKETGCKSLYIGFESINEASLDSVCKHQNRTDEYEHTIRMIHDRDMMINASMVFGFDADGPEVFANTLDWLVENRIETMTTHILTPYPNTRLYKRLESEERIIDRNFSHYNTSRVVFKPKRMTAEELLDGYLKIYADFYSFKNIMKRMPLSRKQRLPYFLFNFGYRKFGRLTSKFGMIGLMASIGKLARRLSYGIG
ncbi:MAG: radical SAM protein [Chitinivibrionales bacterium]|nr:radical SAM protein [Chitinivibrionales bacterium]